MTRINPSHVRAWVDICQRMLLGNDSIFAYLQMWNNFCERNGYTDIATKERFIILAHEEYHKRKLPDPVMTHAFVDFRPKYKRGNNGRR